MTPIEQDYHNGRWVPIYFGNRFKVARQTGIAGAPRGEERGKEKFRSLPEARAECQKRNAAV